VQLKWTFLCFGGSGCNNNILIISLKCFLNKQKFHYFQFPDLSLPWFYLSSFTLLDDYEEEYVMMTTTTIMVIMMSNSDYIPGHFQCQLLTDSVELQTAATHHLHLLVFHDEFHLTRNSDTHYKLSDRNEPLNLNCH